MEIKKNKRGCPMALTLAFDSTYCLRAVFDSVTLAAQITGTMRQSIVKAATDVIISTGNFYWRILPDDMELEGNEIGKMTLFEYDAAIGHDAKIYTGKMGERGTVMYESEYIAQHKQLTNNKK